MRKFNGLEIELTRGDSVRFKVTFAGRTLPEGSIALFTVKKSPRAEETAIEKRMAINSDGSVQIGLSSSDTDLKPRTYFWDIRVLIPLGDGTFEVKTPMEYAAFTITEVIGDA
jgi:hypothetical protein